MARDKISIRFFNDQEVRAVWNESRNAWFFSVLDIVGVLCNQTDYAKNRNYWKWLKAVGDGAEALRRNPRQGRADDQVKAAQRTVIGDRPHFCNSL